MGIDWKARFRNKTFWLSLASAFILLGQELGVPLPGNIDVIINSILTITVILGIVMDPSTSGITDGEK